MNKKFRYLSVLIVLFFLFSLTVFAIEGSENVEVFFRNIKVFVDNEELELEDEPFIYKDRTYIPLRAVSEGMGKEVQWNSVENKISILSYIDIEESDPLNGEIFVYGEITKPIDTKNRTITIEQHFDDNSISVEPDLKLSENVVIVLQRNDKMINLDFEDLRIGDIVGMVITSKDEVRGIIVEG